MGRVFTKIVSARNSTIISPLKWIQKKGRAPGGGLLIFTCSISDFFLPDADPWRERVWRIIRDTPQHTYQILTKRPGRIPDRLPEDWDEGYENVWLGVSLESQSYMERVLDLIKIPAKIHFLSIEPLLGPIYFPGDILSNIDWIIVGGESGPNHRPIDLEWVRDIHRQTREWGVPFFFKGWGGRTAKSGGRILDGRTWDEFPRLGEQ